MELLVERFVCKNKRCFTCGTLVYAVEKKMTTNHVYHERCFCCRICKRNLTGSSLNEEGDDIYCTNCYRKKQRGDCNNRDFYRATAERAQFVYNNRHPDQPLPRSNPRPPIQRDLSRQPSWTLRQLERQYLSYQQPTANITKKLNENYHKLISVSQPTTIKTSFSVPVNLNRVRRSSSFTRNQSSPPLHFSPAFSPSPNRYSLSPATKPKTSEQSKAAKTTYGGFKPTLNIIDRALFRSARNNNAPTNTTSPILERKQSIMADLNRKEDRFRFPDIGMTPTRRRDSSASHVLFRRQIK